MDKTHRFECPHCGFTFPKEFQPSGIHFCPGCQQPLSLTPMQFSKGADNIHHRSGCPPIMSDGRFMRDFSLPSELTDRIVRANCLRTSAQIREFIQQNADALMRADRRRAFGENLTNPAFGCSDSWDAWRERQGQLRPSCRRGPGGCQK